MRLIFVSSVCTFCRSKASSSPSPYLNNGRITRRFAAGHFAHSSPSTASLLRNPSCAASTSKKTASHIVSCIESPQQKVKLQSCEAKTIAVGIAIEYDFVCSTHSTALLCSFRHFSLHSIAFCSFLSLSKWAHCVLNQIKLAH